jgi:hypothetical protein
MTKGEIETKRPGAIPAFSFCASSSSAKADDPVRRGFSISTEVSDYWMPAFAGHDNTPTDPGLSSSLRAKRSNP